MINKNCKTKICNFFSKIKTFLRYFLALPSDDFSGGGISLIFNTLQLLQALYSNFFPAFLFYNHTYNRYAIR